MLEITIILTIIWLLGVFHFYPVYKEEINRARTVYQSKHTALEYAICWPVAELIRLIIKISDDEL